MTRYTSTLAFAVATLFLTATNNAGVIAQEHGEHLSKCAKTCADCQLECDMCFKHCLKLVADGKKEHEKTAQLCVDCAECCKTCATLCARNSPLAGPMLECCEKCCKECASACEKHSDDKHMAACAKACRACAKDCAEMLKHLDK